jgi:hypothetical protein
MGWFSNKTDVPNTITDEQMADLSRRAQKSRPMFSQEAVRQRLASNAQQANADKS